MMVAALTYCHLQFAFAMLPVNKKVLAMSYPFITELLM